MDLSEKQSLAVKVACDGHNLLLTGLAGTGKSHVVREIHNQLTRQGRKVQITCSTGIACTVYPAHYNAVTLHKFSGIDDGRHDPDVIASVIENNPRYNHVVKNIMSTDVLIVDECSMISRRTFMSLNNVCSLKGASQSFGGIHLIFCGDFFQLPPVPNRRYDDDGSYCFQSRIFKEVFPHHIILTDINRQNEEDFIHIIEQVYRGSLTEAGIFYVNSLSRPLPSKCESVKLFSTNMLVDQFNRKCLLDQPGDILQYTSVDSGNTAELNILTAAKTLWLKVGCPVILLKNLSHLLVNGLRGTLVSACDNELAVHFPSLEFTARIKKEKFTVFDPKKTSDIAVREQFPLKPAYALTIHKAQGMTLDWVEVDCREIFKPGQLGVAMSRARSSAGLRVINFHARCIFQPPTLVSQFMGELSEEILQDLSCCRFKSAEKESTADLQPVRGREEDLNEPSTDIGLELEDDFNEIISCLDSNEQDNLDFDLPDSFDIAIMLAEITFKKEVTKIHVKINRMISSLHPGDTRVLTFVKKIFIKMSSFLSEVSDPASTSGIQEKYMSAFFDKVHRFTTSMEYVMLCLFLFALTIENSFVDEYRIVSYKITEYIREFLLRQKVDFLKSGSKQINKRFVSDASRSRIRYIAGYSVAKLRNQYVKSMQSSMFVSSQRAQLTFNEAKAALQILNVLKEEEHYLKEITKEPESLLDIERRQYANRRLTNVKDDTFQFFIDLTNSCLPQLSQENLGKSMFNQCLDNIHSDKRLYEQFSHVIVSKLRDEKVKEFHQQTASSDISDLLEQTMVTATQICKIYMEITRKYLMVLFSQFCRDVKSFFRVQKTMAHRKQIKVSKKASEKKTFDKKVLQETQPSTSQTQSPRPGTSNKPDPEDSTLPETQSEISDNDDKELCKKCQKGEGKDWIECDSCVKWYHRKCAGLSNVMKWKKFSKTGVSWLCGDCA